MQHASSLLALSVSLTCLLAPALLMTEAGPLPALGATSIDAVAPADNALLGQERDHIECLGRACGGSGPMQYFYLVSPGAEPVTSVDIGIHGDPGMDPTTYSLPHGWELDIVPVAMPDDLLGTQHGWPTLQRGTCDFTMHFHATDPALAMTAPFNLGVSYPASGKYHDAGWRVESETNEVHSSWLRPVGKGAGPVHSPIIRGARSAEACASDTHGH